MSGIEVQDKKLSCESARLILKLRQSPLDLPAEKMGDDQRAAVKHYIHCADCCSMGLASILEHPIECQEAILIWARSARMLEFGFSTLEERLAIEHVSGKYQWKFPRGGNGWDYDNCCQNLACQTLWTFWHNVPMSSSAGDGASGVIELFPTIINIFSKEGWPLDPVFSLQEARLGAVLECIKSGKVTLSPGHYHSIDELVNEAAVHLRAVHRLVLKIAPWDVLEAWDKWFEPPARSAGGLYFIHELPLFPKQL